jgi:hypothetical protein
LYLRWRSSGFSDTRCHPINTNAVTYDSNNAVTYGGSSDSTYSDAVTHGSALRQGSSGVKLLPVGANARV